MPTNPADRAYRSRVAGRTTVPVATLGVVERPSGRHTVSDQP